MKMKLLSVPILTLSLSAALFGGCAPAGDPARNQQESTAFLAEKAKKPGIIATASGLQYEVLQEGTGASPAATEVVTVNYRGSLPSGTVFDSGENITFPLNGVIAGWTEGLQLMKTGARYRFFIPPQLAYGEAGAGRAIGPNMALVFEVELLKVGR